jgi:lysophospholipase L1-like esterase
VDERATLVVFTVGGNDIMSLAEDFMAGASVEEIDAEADEAIRLMDEALDWLADARETRFPNGLYAVYGNIYEYTDGTGDLSLCPAAEILGFSGEVPEVRDADVRVNEAWVGLAVEHGFDVAFLLEWFCGHGFLAGDPENECYRGADAETWFDASCIHPNPEGHAQIAEMFHTIVSR